MIPAGMPVVEPTSHVLSLFAGNPMSLVHLVECLGRSRNELRHAMKRAETDLATAMADEDDYAIACLREQMVDVHSCRGILRTFATEIVASDSDDRDFDESVLFAPDASAGLDELASLRSSNVRMSREGKNYVDLSRIRGIFEEARRDNRTITKAWMRANLPPGSGAARSDIPLLEGTVVLGVPGKMVRLSTVEVMAILDVTTGTGGCYPESESEDDASDAYDPAEDEAAEDDAAEDEPSEDDAAEDEAAEDDVEMAEAVPSGSSERDGSSVLVKFLRSISVQNWDHAVLGTTNARGAGTGMLKFYPQVMGVVRSYISSTPGVPPGSLVSTPGKTSKHKLIFAGWSMAMRQGLLAAVQAF